MGIVSRDTAAAA